MGYKIEPKFSLREKVLVTFVRDGKEIPVIAEITTIHASIGGIGKLYTYNIKHGNVVQHVPENSLKKL